jgi:hypothetical protein
MPHPLSNDLPERVVAFVEADNSCNEAARHFDTSVSFAVNLLRRGRETERAGLNPTRVVASDMASLRRTRTSFWRRLLPSAISPCRSWLGNW